MFLLDTVVLSELRRRHRNPGLVSWLGGQTAAELFVSVITMGEIARGIVQSRDAVFAASLAVWMERVMTSYGERILPFDLAAARRWGELSAEIGHDGADLMIAATGLDRGLTVVTRNVRHFQPTGVAVLNPFT
jgi:toxin FitB